MATTTYSNSRKSMRPKLVSTLPPGKKSTATDVIKDGTYARSTAYFYALEYAYGSSSDIRRYNTIVRLLLTALVTDDIETVSKVVGTSDPHNHERDVAWESLTLGKKRQRIALGELPTSPRYGRELSQLSTESAWSDEDIYKHDLVGLYRSLPKADRQVGYIVNGRSNKVGTSTQLAIQYNSFNILLHQCLYEGLVLSHHYILDLVRRGVDSPLLAALVLHLHTPKPIHIHSCILEAARNGCLEIVLYMATCGTLPTRKVRDEIMSQLVIRSVDASVIKKGEECSHVDRARDCRIVIVREMLKYDGAEASRLADIRIATDEDRALAEAAAAERARLAATTSVTEEDLIDLDALDLDTSDLEE